MSVNLPPKDLAFDPRADASVAAVAPSAPRFSFVGALRSVRGRIVAWQERARMRRGLAAMDDRLLRDIGLTRAQASREFGKPFWRP